jgi:8-oxo-dGTP pyrophosphatase MutT (NUDIX family)
VTGGLHAGERAPLAARREVAEETGLGDDAIEAMFDLDQIGSFYADDLDAIVNSVIYAVRVRADAVARLSGEHAGMEWVDAEAATTRSIWPPYRESIRRILRLVAEPEWAHWFGLDADGRRTAR